MNREVDNSFKNDAGGQVAAQKLSHEAADWLRANFNRINTNNDEGLTKLEIIDFASNTNHIKSTRDMLMADALLRPDSQGKTLFDDIARRSPNSVSNEQIEKCDLRAFERQERRQERREAKHDGVLEDAAPLFEGKPCLMEVLDRQGNGQVDGRVSERDMRRFLVQCEIQHDGIYNKENAQFVSDLLNGKYPNITGSNFTGFSAEALSRRGGLDHLIVRGPEDYDKLIANYEKATHPGGETPNNVAPLDLAPQAVAPDGPLDSPSLKDRTTEREDVIDKEATRLTDGQVRDMCKLAHGEGYWHVAERLLNAGFPPNERATNLEIMALTRMLLAENHSHMDAHGKPVPMVHPEQIINDGTMGIISERMPRLAKSLHNLYEINRQKVAECDE